ncbi:unnamed protein product [Camellia sinensis]
MRMVMGLWVLFVVGFVSKCVDGFEYFNLTELRFESFYGVSASNGRLADCKCAFEAIFNFGDSNSDTGGFWAAFPAQSGPYGMTYFKKPAGRATDGRLMIDFLAQALGLPFLSPYLQSIGSDYRHGANFATSASTVLLPKSSLFVSGLSPFTLAIQLNQMKHFKVKVDEPQSNVIDFTPNLGSLGMSGSKIMLSQVVSQIAATIKRGRTFLVLNLAPVGCYPLFLAGLPHNSSDLDAFGCVISYNNAVVDYNNMLKEALNQTRQAIPDASLIYVDTHAILLELFQHPTSHDYNFDPKVYCGNTKVINGSTLTATACSDPYNYVSWDGIHALRLQTSLSHM